MKKVLLTAAILGSVFAANAQSGKFYLGGGLSFNSNTQTADNGSGTKSVDNSTSTLGIMPEAGYFLKDNMALGLALQYSRTSMTDNIANANPKSTTTSLFALNPYFRYFCPATESLKFFAQLNVVYASGTNSQTVSTGPTPADVAVSGFAVSVVPGIAWAATSKVTLVSTLGTMYSANGLAANGLYYNSMTQDRGSNGKSTNSNVGISLLNGISFGLYYTLN